jgi:uncharacterized protein with HEPN domain
LSFKDSRRSLRDILDAIASIEQFTLGMDLEAFRSDAKTVAAVERKLLVISEAAIRLGDQGPALCPDQPWPKIRGTGNWIRHQYERINLDDIWRTLMEDLPPLKASARQALKMPANPKLNDPPSD